MRSKIDITRDIRSQWGDIVAYAVERGASRAPLARLPQDVVLLTQPTGQYKLEKGLKLYGVESYGLTLPAHRTLGPGVNFCARATKGCPSACLIYSGQLSMSPAENSRFWKGTLWLGSQDLFMDLAMRELEAVQARCVREDIFATFRGNIVSDLPWMSDWLAEESQAKGYDRISFLDYTKYREYAFRSAIGASRVWRVLSFNKGQSGVTWRTCERLLRVGGSVAVMVDVQKDEPVPDTFRGFETVDGDVHDIRNPNEAGRVILLRVKGTRTKTKQRARKLAMAL